MEKLSGLLRVLVPETNLQAVALCAATGDPALFDDLLAGVRVLRPKDNVPRLSPRQREVLAIGTSVPELHPNALFEGAHSDMRIRMPALCALLGAAPAESRVAGPIRRTRRLWMRGYGGAVDLAQVATAFPRLEQLVVCNATEVLGLNHVGELNALGELAFLEIGTLDTTGLRLPASCWSVGISGVSSLNTGGLAGARRVGFDAGLSAARIMPLKGVHEILCTRYTALTRADLDALAALPDLRSLHIDWVKGDAPVDLAVFRASRLTHLRFMHMHVDLPSLAHLADHPTLQRLELHADVVQRVPAELWDRLPLV